ncbi:MAG: hypothetical protein H7Y38_00015 [Armatimonadetes bacterium]|nr:hypothetical protein [Armatimonadota bacterium]
MDGADTNDWRKRPVAGIGIVGLDHVAVTDTWERDGKSVASLYFEQVGGPVPVALMAMARLGLADAPCFCGIVGRDAAGRTITRELRDGGVDTSQVRHVSGGKTSHSLIVLSDGKNRSLTNYVGTGISEAAGVAPFADVNVGLLHLDGRDLCHVERVTNRVWETVGKISLDLGSKKPSHAKILPLCDIVIASKPGGAGAFPEVGNCPIEQTKRFLDAGAIVAGVTLGADGAVIGCRDENGGVPLHLPAFRVPNVVDTCGAGDLFHGAFLWAWREGQGVFDAATFAQAAVALRIQRVGNAHQPTRAEVEAFLAAPVP